MFQGKDSLGEPMMTTRYWKPYQIGPLAATEFKSVEYYGNGNRSLTRQNISPPSMATLSWQWAAWNNIISGGELQGFIRYILDVPLNARRVKIQKASLWCKNDWSGTVWGGNEGSLIVAPTDNIDDPSRTSLAPLPTPSGKDWTEQWVGSDVDPILELSDLTHPWYIFLWEKVVAGTWFGSWITHLKSGLTLNINILEEINLKISAIDQYSGPINDFVLQVYEDDETTRVDISDISAVNGVAEVQLESGKYYVKCVKGTDESNLVLADCENDLSLTIVLPIGVPSTEKVSFSAKVTSQGNMISAALVTLKPIVYSEKTDLQGETPTRSGVPKGTYTLECVKDGYEIYSKQVTLLIDTSLYPIELIPITVPPTTNLLLPIAIGIGSILAIGTGYYFYKGRKKKPI